MKAHQLNANPLVTGHLLLSCPICGYRVQIDQTTLERKTLNPGQREQFQHTWTLTGGVSVAGEVAPSPSGKAPGAT